MSSSTRLNSKAIAPPSSAQMTKKIKPESLNDDLHRPRLNSNRLSETANNVALPSTAQKPNATPCRKNLIEGPFPSETTISPMTRATPGDYSMRAPLSTRRRAHDIILNPESTSPPVAQKLFKCQSSQNHKAKQEKCLDEDVDYQDELLVSSS